MASLEIALRTSPKECRASGAHHSKRTTNNNHVSSTSVRSKIQGIRRVRGAADKKAYEDAGLMRRVVW